jgi:fibro-slime domain-containing protein
MSSASSFRTAAFLGLSWTIGACLDGRQVGVATAPNEPAAAGGSNSVSNLPVGDGPGSMLGPAGSGGSTPEGNGSPPTMPARTGSAAGSMLTVTPPSGCGDRVLAADEACDDGNRVSGDGCAADCGLAEAGFSCAGEYCMPIARCGDSWVAASEQCDDGNLGLGDGCSDRCAIESGKLCQGQPSVCTDAVCGNSIKEGAEACDDGNVLPFDGCSERCQREAECVGTSCVSSCGDGLVLEEDCDDGNLMDGDGCSSACLREVGYTCSQQPDCELLGDQCVWRTSALFRDFANTHPDFGNKACNARVPGAVASLLDAAGRPAPGSTDTFTPACLSTAANFADWYTSNARNVTVAREFLLFSSGAGTYVNRFGAEGQQFDPRALGSPTQLPSDGNPLFFPVDAINGATAQREPASIPVQYGAATVTPESVPFPGAPAHNFSFTSEMQYRFVYAADTAAALTIGADDDLWVFLNGRLVLDLGGVHEPLFGRLTIDAAQGLVTALVLDGARPNEVTATSVYGLAAGSIFTLSIFHAERKPPLSSFSLNLEGFQTDPSQCFALCGDGLLSAGEECDNGRNDGGYGACQPGCVLGPYCGDGITQPEMGESCDVGPGGDAVCRGCRVLGAR